MEYSNPYKTSFEEIKKIEKITSICLWISTIVIITSFIYKSLFTRYFNILEFISNINILLILAYPILTIISDVLFYQVSISRREDFIDNSFNSVLAENRSNKYFTNDYIPAGIYKMAVNSFENCFFTYSISKKMKLKLLLKNICFIILILSFALCGFTNLFILFMQLSLPIVLLSKAIKHAFFVSRIHRVLENYRRIFNDMINHDDSKYKRPELILNLLDYETTITFGSILLDSKLYDKLNPSLSKKWSDIKQQYKIETV